MEYKNGGFMRKISILLIGLFVSCSSMYEARDSVKVKSDQYSNTTTVLGIEKKSDNGNVKFSYFLRSWVKKGNIKHQVYVSSFYYAHDWYYFNGAKDMFQKSLKFTRIDSDVDCSTSLCRYSEMFGAMIPHERLLKTMDEGYKLKFYSHSGTTIVLKLTPTQISEQIETVKNTPRTESNSTG